MNADNEAAATPAQEDGSEVIVTQDEVGEAYHDASSGMMLRQSGSRVYRLGSLTSSVSEEWQTSTSLWTTVGTYAGAPN